MATAVYMEEQGSLYAWYKNEGDPVKQGDLLAEVDKLDVNGTTVEIRAGDSGVLRKRLVEKGYSGGADTLIAVIAGADEDISAFAGNGGPAASGAGATVQAPSAERGEAAGIAAPTVREAAEAAPAQASAAMAPAAVQGTDGGRIQAPAPAAPPRETEAQGAASPSGNAPALREGAGVRSEPVDGRAVAPGGASLVHNLIVGQVVGALVPALRGTACRVVSQGMPVRPGRGQSVFFPDVAVFCGAAELEPGGVEVLLNPVVVVEVLSPESTDFDHGKKWESYRRVPSLRDYLLVWHDQARVEWYTRQGAHWLFGEVEGEEAEVRLESIGVTLRLDGIYQGVLAADQPSA